MDQQKQPRPALAVLTSGGDSQGMNATVRAVVRTALAAGADAYAVYEGLQGLVDGGDRIRHFDWEAVGSIMHLGGTVIGTARSADFRERQGRLRAARNLVERGIDRMVVVGGDGSLTGTNLFRQEWKGLLAELVGTGEITDEQAEAHKHLIIAGVVGSIDNDMVGTDKTVGADTAMHRIIEAIDALSSTASSHQRSFVVEVMGRHCGYLALMCAIAGGADYVLIPEERPAAGWEDDLIARIAAGRAAGRRGTLAIVAEGVTDEQGQPVTSQRVAQVISQRLGEDTRVTILGHVQRGGAPSAYDRWMPTLMGHAAALEVLGAEPESEPQLIGIRHNRVSRTPLMEAVTRTREIPNMIEAGDYKGAMAARGSSFPEMFRVFEGISQSEPEYVGQGTRLAIMHAGGLAPGMNAAAQAAVRFGMWRGHTMFGVRGGYRGLMAGRFEELAWGDVEGWVGLGGAELGTSRREPRPTEFGIVNDSLKENRIDGLLIIGGHRGYATAHMLDAVRGDHPGMNIPLICMPASIDNNLPQWEMSVGADTALNAIVEAVDRIKQSASASRRAFVVEVMGRNCGFLALMGALSTGAEEVYLNEEGVTLSRLNDDVRQMVDGFRSRGRRFHLGIRNEEASVGYTTEFLCQLFTEESEGLFDVRPMILGHLQQGGNPTAFDRVHAARLAAFSIDWLTGQVLAGRRDWRYVADVDGRLSTAALKRMPETYDMEARRPKQQWWMDLKPVMEQLAREPLEGGSDA
ncbi:MAG: 6-phosphofructokinase [Candidatus Nanopelagicales bacterium]